MSPPPYLGVTYSLRPACATSKDGLTWPIQAREEKHAPYFNVEQRGEVENILDTIEDLKNKNIKLIGDKILMGAKGSKVMFVHPKSTGGVLVEFAEKV